MQSAAEQIVDVLWSLMETGQEELKLLQTDILLLTTNSVVQHDALAKVSPVVFIALAIHMCLLHGRGFFSGSC